MPKITNHKCSGYCVDISYDVQQDNFYINLPADLCGYGSNGKLCGATKREVVNSFDAVVSRFLQEKVVREKYLVIELDQNDGGWMCDDDIKRAGGQAGFLKLQWAVVDKIIVDGEARYVYAEERFRHGFRQERIWESEGKVFIPWSEGREAFLKRTTDALKELAKRIDVFILGDGDLGKKIDEARVPLLPSGSNRPVRTSFSE